MPRTNSTLHPIIRSAICPLLGALIAGGCVSPPDLPDERRDTIVGIEVGIEPDATVAARTSAATSHISLVRCFVRGRELHLVSAVVAHVMSTTDLARLSLQETGLRSAGGAVVMDASPEFRRLEERIVELIRPFTVDGQTSKSFIATPDGSAMSPDTIEEVGRFVPDGSGVNFRPSMPLAPGQADTAQPSAAVTFQPVGVSVYQLDRVGVAQRRLWTWRGETGAGTR